MLYGARLEGGGSGGFFLSWAGSPKPHWREFEDKNSRLAAVGPLVQGAWRGEADIVPVCRITANPSRLSQSGTNSVSAAN